MNRSGLLIGCQLSGRYSCSGGTGQHPMDVFVTVFNKVLYLRRADFLQVVCGSDINHFNPNADIGIRSILG